MKSWALIKKSYKEIYQNIFSILLISMFWFFGAGVFLITTPLWIQANYYIPIILAFFLIGPITAASFYVSNRIVNYEEFRIRDLFIGIKKYLIKSSVITWLIILLYIIVGVNFYFYLKVDNTFFRLLAPLFIYLAIFLSVIVLYIFPLMMELDKLGKARIRDIFGYAFVFTVKNILFTLLIFFNILVFGTINIVITFGLPTLFMGGVALMANNATLNLLVKQGVIEEVNGPYDFS